MNKIMKKQVLIAIGIISLILGVIGIFLPLLPTTPFILLSSFCFSKSSEKLHSFLINNKVFGKYLKDYEEKRGITLKNKIFVIAFLTCGIGYSFYRVENLHARIALAIIWVGVSIHIIRMKTLK